MKYKHFLDISILQNYNEILSKNIILRQVPIVISSIGLKYIDFDYLKDRSSSVFTWEATVNKEFLLHSNDELLDYLAAKDYENTMAPDELIYITHNPTMAYLANHYFGNDSIIFL